MNKLKKILIAYILLGGASLLFGADYFMLTDVGASSRTIGRGGVEGFDSYAVSIFENPAGLNRMNKLSVDAFSTTFIGEITYTSLSSSVRTKYGIFGFGYYSAVVGDVPHTAIGDEEFIVASYFDYKSTISKFTYARPIKEHILFGASMVNYGSEIYTTTSSASDFDLGAIYFYRKTEFSGFFRNLFGSKAEYSNGNYENLPFQFLFSVKQPLGAFNVLAQYKRNGSKGSLKSFAITYRNSRFNYLELSAGYKQFFVLDEVDSNIVLGLNLDIATLSFSYAYESSDHPEFNHKSYFSTSINF